MSFPNVLGVNRSITPDPWFLNCPCFKVEPERPLAGAEEGQLAVSDVRLCSRVPDSSLPSMGSWFMQIGLTQVCTSFLSPLPKHSCSFCKHKVNPDVFMSNH